MVLLLHHWEDQGSSVLAEAVDPCCQCWLEDDPSKHRTGQGSFVGPRQNYVVEEQEADF